jgi:hypothetical protein
VTPGIQVISNGARPDVEKFVSKQYIKDYLELQVGIKSHGGKVFCGYEPMGMRNDGQQIQLYLWIACSEYYWSDQGLKTGTAISIPAVLFVEWRGLYQIVDYKDGMGDPSIKTNFPQEIQNIILIAQSKDPAILVNGISALDQLVEEEAKAYFDNQ